MGEFEVTCKQVTGHCDYGAEGSTNTPRPPRCVMHGWSRLMVNDGWWRHAVIQRSKLMVFFGFYLFFKFHFSFVSFSFAFFPVFIYINWFRFRVCWSSSCLFWFLFPFRVCLFFLFSFLFRFSFDLFWEGRSVSLSCVVFLIGKVIPVVSWLGLLCQWSVW